MGRPPPATEREGSRATNTRAGAPAEEVAAAAESVTVENLRKELADAQKLRRAADKRALEAEAKVDEQETKRRKNRELFDNMQREEEQRRRAKEQQDAARKAARPEAAQGSGR